MSKKFFSAFEVTNQVFYQSELSFAFVNLFPVLPGHVLVVPNRVVQHTSDLTAEELNDLFATSRVVGEIVKKAFKGEALTWLLQDGVASGQTVPHVHVHLVPRSFEDYKGDNMAIFPDLDKSEETMAEALAKPKRNAVPMNYDIASTGTPRTPKEMEDEATWLRSLAKL